MKKIIIFLAGAATVVKKTAILFAALGAVALSATSCDDPARENGEPVGIPAAAGEISGPSTVYAGYSIALTVNEIADATTYKWYKDGLAYQNARSRELTVTEPGIYRVAGINRFGEGVPSPEKTISASSETPLIERMVGKWDVHEYIANPNNNKVDYNDHVITIKKVNDNTIEISNFTWRNYPDPDGIGEMGDTLKAQIDNENGTMYILPPAQFIPTWAEDRATLLSPVISAVETENVGREFPRQNIAENSDGDLEIVFQTGNQTKVINIDQSTSITVPVTYFVATVQADFYTGSVAYYLDTVWTKQ